MREARELSEVRGVKAMGGVRGAGEGRGVRGMREGEKVSEGVKKRERHFINMYARGRVRVYKVGGRQTSREQGS